MVEVHLERLDPARPQRVNDSLGSKLQGSIRAGYTKDGTEDLNLQGWTLKKGVRRGEAREKGEGRDWESGRGAEGQMTGREGDRGETHRGRGRGKKQVSDAIIRSDQVTFHLSERSCLLVAFLSWAGA